MRGRTEWGKNPRKTALTCYDGGCWIENKRSPGAFLEVGSTGDLTTTTTVEES